MSNQQITLDCAPGMTRPGDLLPGVLRDTGIEPREPISKFFGSWVWDFSDIDPDTWSKHHQTIAYRIRALYNEGRIRYGEW